VLFADLVGYTTLAESRDPEHVKNLVDGCFERLAADIVAHGGRVDKIVGDAIMALFGAPQAHEDDAERAVRAGLQMQRTLESSAADLGVDIRMRVGINSGEVLVGALRAGGDYTAMGDVVNTASRLQTAAEAGQVLVGPTTHAATREVLRYRSLGLVRARGREEPVPAWIALEAVAPPGYRPRRVRTPLIGRDAELGILRNALTLAKERRRAHLVVLSGDAGTGKTRLAEEISTLARSEHHGYVLEGRCVPYGESNVWWPLAEALRRSCGITAADDHDTIKSKGQAAVGAMLGVPAGDRELERVLKGLSYLMDQEDAELEPARARDEAVRSVAVCLERMTVDRPLVFAVSELHWADDLLLEFLDRLLDRVQNLPILMVATSRPELAERWHPPAGRHNQFVIHIDPLDHEATSALLDALVGEGSAPLLREALVERSGGNPLFLEELVALLGPEHALDELPATLRGLVAARLDALGPLERDTLEDAAIAGRRGAVAALAAMAPPDRAPHVEDAVAALVATDLLALSETGQGCSDWEFRSEVVREVAYGTLTKGERARRHAALGEWLAGQVGERLSSEDLDELTHHYGTAAELILEVGGVDGIPVDTGAKALAWVERAAARAESEELWLPATGLLDQGLRLAAFGPTGTRSRLLLARARARVGVRDATGARADLSEVIAEAEQRGDTRALISALMVTGDVERIEGRIDESSSSLRRAAEMAGAAGEDQIAADALRRLGQSRLFAGDDEGADAASAEALEAFRLLGDRRGEAWALQSLAWTAFMRGNFGPAEERLTASANAFSEIGDWGGHSWALGLLAWVRYGQGRLEEARSIGEGVLAEASQGSDRWAIGMMTTLMANVCLWTGRTAQAVGHGRAARALMTEINDRWGEAQSLVPIARGLLALGRIEEGRDALDEGRRVAEQVQDARTRRLGEGGVVIALVQQLGEGAEVLGMAQGIMEADPDLVQPEWRAAVGLALVQTGRTDEGVLLLERALESNTHHPQTNLGAMMALGLLAAGRTKEAEVVLNRDCPVGSGTYADQCWAGLARGLAAVQRGDAAGAKDAFADTLAVVDATEDVLAQATVRVARQLALGDVGDDDGAESLARMGIDLAGWVHVFRAAAEVGRAAVG